MTTRASNQDGTYPRPQLVRAAHASLDREVGFAFDDDDRGRSDRWFARPEVFDRTIRLPFAPESADSGIGDTGYHRVVWYRIELSSADLDAAGWRTQGDRLLLHFGAVDYAAEVWVDGTHVTSHEGGQTAFSADVTDALADTDEHVVVVRAEDDPIDATLPRGKQDWRLEPHGIWYHRTTGIWRTVWLEAVPALHIQRLIWTPDVAAAQVHLEVELNRRPDEPVDLDVVVAHDGAELAQARVRSGAQTVRLTLPIAGHGNAQEQHTLFWSPERPTLLDATVTVVGGDTVASYLGLRSVGIAAGRFLLNEHPYYVRSVLEQGYWPTSGFTAPSNAALREEVELIKSLGFNAARIHQKVEDPRFVYWCDRLGLMLWGETANAFEFNALAVQRLSTEWGEIVRQFQSHPSIVTWVPLNESWGVQHGMHDPARRAYAVGLANLTRALDPTRPVISNDGWEHTDSDMWTIHDYESSGEVLRARYGTPQAVAEVVSGVGPAGRLISLTPVEEVTAPVMLTEFGGVSYVVGEVPEGSWGYSTASGPDDFARRLTEILSAVHASDQLDGFCYTQLTDTLQETNGLCTADRRPKIDSDTLAAIIRGDQV